jgi:hypothetical protein
MKGKNTGNETVQAVIHVFMESHNETPCVAILNKQNVIFFNKNRDQEGKTSPVWGIGTEEGRSKERVVRVSMVNNVCICA